MDQDQASSSLIRVHIVCFNVKKSSLKCTLIYAADVKKSDKVSEFCITFLVAVDQLHFFSVSFMFLSNGPCLYEEGIISKRTSASLPKLNLE